MKKRVNPEMKGPPKHIKEYSHLLNVCGFDWKKTILKVFTDMPRDHHASDCMNLHLRLGYTRSGY